MSKKREQAMTKESIEGCCGGPTPANAYACGVADAEAKAAGDNGCECGTAQHDAQGNKASACC